MSEAQDEAKSDTPIEEPTHDGDWEMIDSPLGTIREFRQRVPGGWLVLCSSETGGGLVFLPDPQGVWNPPIKQSRKKGSFY